MTDPDDDQRHWMERKRAAASGNPPHGQPRSASARWSGWGFLLCAAVAVGYGLWALYGSGARVLNLEVTHAMEYVSTAPDAPRYGPLRLDPGMNPMRAVLGAAHAPVGSTRLHYELALEDAGGTHLWEARSFFGSRDDKASIVTTRTSLATFDVPRAGDYYVRVHSSGSSMDDLREATLELRRNVLPVDARIPWGFGLAALAFLISSLVAARVGPGSRRATGESPRRAA